MNICYLSKIRYMQSLHISDVVNLKLFVLIHYQCHTVCFDNLPSSSTLYVLVQSQTNFALCTTYLYLSCNRFNDTFPPKPLTAEEAHQTLREKAYRQWSDLAKVK